MTSAADRRPGADQPVAPASGPDSALPSVLARLLAFVAVFIGAGAGGTIGHSFATLAGFGGTAVGFITFLSILLGAGGVAVVSVLTLRAFGEWETIRSKGD
ncbi:MAG: hypothetical protein WBF71_00315 [Microthrixaceae bacterium]